MEVSILSMTLQNEQQLEISLSRTLDSLSRIINSTFGPEVAPWSDGGFSLDPW